MNFLGEQLLFILEQIGRNSQLILLGQQQGKNNLEMNSTVCALHMKNIFLTSQLAHSAVHRNALLQEHATVSILCGCRRKDSLNPGSDVRVCREVQNSSEVGKHPPQLEKKGMCTCTDFHQTLTFIFLNIRIYFSLI